MRRLAEAREMMESLTVGVEVETTGLGNRRAAEVIAATIGGRIEVEGGYYSKVAIVAPDGRKWTTMYDGSITGGSGSEVVSPILRGDEDIETLQTIVRALRAAGAKSSAGLGCGVHVHIGVGHLDARAICRIAKTAAKFDAFIRRGAGVTPSRGNNWACPLDVPTRTSRHVANLDALSRARTLDELGIAWYGTRAGLDSARAGNHYDGSRYHGLNLHSVFYRSRGTVEFRYFDGTMHAGKIKAYVHLCRAIVAKGALTRSASATPRVIETREKATAVLHMDLGLSGEKYATARKHLTAGWPTARERAAAAVEAATAAGRAA